LLIGHTHCPGLLRHRVRRARPLLLLLVPRDVQHHPRRRQPLAAQQLRGREGGERRRRGDGHDGTERAARLVRGDAVILTGNDSNNRRISVYIPKE
jgi:hypothetical protein